MTSWARFRALCNDWNDLVRDFFALVSIVFTGLAAFLLGGLTNARWETLLAIPSGHPFLWPALVLVGLVFFVLLGLLVIGDLEKHRQT